ncbi:MAG: hypothetical protein JWO28_2663 [Hyphomicrobiales bacterium]|nr:hypothetical protein [Hyphomicrobiales bacterium]
MGEERREGCAGNQAEDRESNQYIRHDISLGRRQSTNSGDCLVLRWPTQPSRAAAHRGVTKRVCAKSA